MSTNESSKKGTQPEGDHGRNPTPQVGGEGSDIKDPSAEGEHLRKERAPTTDPTATK